MSNTTSHGLAELKWKPDWATARKHHEQWWRGEGLVFWCTAPRDVPHEQITKPTSPHDPHDCWYDVDWRIARDEHRLANMHYAADAFPFFSTWSGAGDLAAYLGCPTDCDHSTVWFEPTMPDPPESHPPLKVDPETFVFQRTMQLTEHAVARSNGRYLVSQPDIIENIDILASLRGTELLLMDMIERPEWVEQCLWQINDAFYEAFDRFYEMIADAHGGNTFVFNVWGPGKTAKVQCDACAMFGPDMFRRFVAPPLRAQCNWLDYAMYHLDGEDALPNLDVLLEIDTLQAIEWTPRYSSQGDTGGKPKFYDLYRRILDAGKSVQAIHVQSEEVLPLLDAVGPKGMFITTHCKSQDEADELAAKVEAYR